MTRPTHGIIAAHDYLAKRGRINEHNAEARGQALCLLLGMSVIFGMIIYAA